MPDAPPSAASTAAEALLGALVDAGLRHVVVSPGSRSQALALAAAAFERSGRVRLHVRVDERVAGFTALGIGIETGVPAAVVTTSGTAVAELHPAVLEAHHAGVPMLLLTADRPVELRGVGANQATVQPGMFAGAVRATVDVPAPADATDAVAVADAGVAAFRTATVERGPVHVNLAFREPLSGASLAHDAAAGSAATGSRDGRSAASSTAGGGAALDEAVLLEGGPRTVVVAGDKAGERAVAFAEALGAPLLAEVSSGARFGRHVVAAYRRLLDEPGFGDRVERVVVFGHPTLSRQVPALLARADVETVLVGPPGGEWFDPTGGRARRVAAVSAAGTGDPTWLRDWVTASRALVAETDDVPPLEGDRRDHARAELAALRAPVTRRALVDAVWKATWPHDRLVLAASRLIREADAVVPGKRIRVAANRGLAGIDGTIGTAFGVALAAEARGTTRVLIGDLALLHDAGALLLAPGEPRPRIQVLVGADGGGTLFDALEVAATADTDDFDRVVRTPRPVDLVALAAAYGWSYRRIENRGDLERALTAPEPGPGLLEVPLAR